MAKGLATLVRVNEWTVDEKRRALGVLLRQLDDLEMTQQNLESEVVKEQQSAAQAPEEAGFLYGIYAEGVILRRQELDKSIAAKDAEINTAREALNEAYRELKKYEVIRDNRQQREQDELTRKDQIALDELGLETYRRRTKPG
jgi:flagellar protein FliJ